LLGRLLAKGRLKLFHTHPKNNLTALPRLAVLPVLSQASALQAYFFK
jgi:hypothetical protein